MSNYTPQEKIDFIFEELQKQKTARIIKNILKLIMLFLLIYSYFTFIYGLSKKEIMNNISSFIGEIVKPITENIVNDMVKKNSLDVNNIPPEMIEKLMKK